MPAPQFVKFIVEVMPLVRDAGEQIVAFSATGLEFIVEVMPLVRDAGEQIVVFSATHRS